MIEAAVAYYEATGKTVLLETMKRMADHIYDLFIVRKKPCQQMWQGMVMM